MEKNEDKNTANQLSNELRDKFSKMWKFKLSGDFYRDLAMKESSNNHKIVNRLGYMGLYQMGTASLIDAGYIDRKDRKTWTGKYGIHSREDFLNDRQVQEIAIREYHEIVWRYLAPVHKYEGETIAGITLSKAGMISAAHLVGQLKLMDFIFSNGKINERDKNEVPGSQYLEGFSEHKEVDITKEGYLKTLPPKEVERFSLNDNLEPNDEIKALVALMKELEETLSFKAYQACEIRKKFEEKLADLLDKFRLEQLKELEEQKEVVIAEIKQEMEQYLPGLEGEIKGKYEKARADAQAYCDQVLLERKMQAEMTLQQDQGYFISNADVIAQKNAELAQYKIQLQCEMSQKIEQKMHDLTKVKDDQIHQQNIKNHSKHTEMTILCQKEIQKISDKLNQAVQSKEQSLDGVEAEAEQFVAHIEDELGLQFAGESYEKEAA